MTTRLVSILGLGNPKKSPLGYDPVEYSFAGRGAARTPLVARAHAELFAPVDAVVLLGTEEVRLARHESGEVAQELGRKYHFVEIPKGGSEAERWTLFEKLRAALRGMPMARRTARFVAEVVIVDATGAIVAAARGACEGHVLDEERGDGGFGYDRLFQPLGHTRTLAELGAEEKDALSHRGEAIRRLVSTLAQLDAAG